jgi:5-methylcytosine-specific restriction endonuclease McrA
MSTLPKRSRVRSDREHYDRLRKRILERDGWRCQRCGAASQLEVHHLQLRSRGGEDFEENLITLCNHCHSAVHAGGFPKV